VLGGAARAERLPRGRISVSTMRTAWSCNSPMSSRRRASASLTVRWNASCLGQDLLQVAQDGQITHACALRQSGVAVLGQREVWVQARVLPGRYFQPLSGIGFQDVKRACRSRNCASP